jgi:hypothetical protein
MSAEALLLSLLLAGASTAVSAPASPPEPVAGLACASMAAVTPVERLSGEALTSMAAAFAGRNEGVIDRLDAQLKAGAYGPPGAAAMTRARAAAKVSLLNVYHFLFELASDADRVLEVDEAALEPVYRSFTDSGLFPSALLVQGRLGRGRVCLRYDLSRERSGRTVLGGLPLRYRVKNERIEGTCRRVLSLIHPSGSVSHFEALIAEHYCFRISRTLSSGPPAPYQLYAAHEVEGGWVRRWGLHRPAAFIFWASPAASDPPQAPVASALAGVRVYIPGLRLDLPVLPSIGLNDLRTLELPRPLLRVDYVRSGRCPRWLVERGEELQMADWQGLGPTPPRVRERFPDR